MKILRYRPAFFEGFDSPEDLVEFKSKEDLFEIPWIKSWTEEHNFHKFSLSNNKLMAEMDGGKEWWVVGFFKDDPSELEIPAWIYKEKK